MGEDHPFLEKQMGHKTYGHVPRLGKIAIWLVLAAIACSLVLYLAVMDKIDPVAMSPSPRPRKTQGAAYSVEVSHAHR